MNPDVASRTVPVPGISHVVGCRLQLDAVRLPAEAACAVMALQTQGEDDWSLQQAGIRRPVRGMTGFATIHPHRRVFIQKRAPLVRMALEARLFVLQPRIHEMRPAAHFPSRPARSMRVVAIRTIHEPFVDAMLEGLRKLSTHIVVTTVADFRLTLRQQISIRLRLVDRMTSGADHVRLRVIAFADIRP